RGDRRSKSPGERRGSFRPGVGRYASQQLERRDPTLRLAPMRGAQLELWPDGDDPVGIDVLVAAVIMAANVLEIAGLRDPGNLVDLPHEPPQIGVIDHPLAVALEVGVIDEIE